MKFLLLLPGFLGLFGSLALGHLWNTLTWTGRAGLTTIDIRESVSR